jgi:hypothetical protein
MKMTVKDLHCAVTCYHFIFIFIQNTECEVICNVLFSLKDERCLNEIKLGITIKYHRFTELNKNYLESANKTSRFHIMIEKLAKTLKKNTKVERKCYLYSKFMIKKCISSSYEKWSKLSFSKL